MGIKRASSKFDLFGFSRNFEENQHKGTMEVLFRLLWMFWCPAMDDVLQIVGQISFGIPTPLAFRVLY
ncbi:hypothetical protein AKJ16_DCAP11818 [Drosera capensis]